MTRQYRLARRAETQGATRRRIVDAAIELHQEVGPTFTTMTNIAARAGVGRVTVYRHFADELDLLRACSGTYFDRHRMPTIEPSEGRLDPVERLRRTLVTVYAYHSATEKMMSLVLAQVGDQPFMRAYHDHWDDLAGQLSATFDVRGRRRILLKAAIRLSLSFQTWNLLVREHGLSESQAIDLLLRLAAR